MMAPNFSITHLSSLLAAFAIWTFFLGFLFGLVPAAAVGAILAAFRWLVGRYPPWWAALGVGVVAAGVNLLAPPFYQLLDNCLFVPAYERDEMVRLVCRNWHARTAAFLALAYVPSSLACWWIGRRLESRATRQADALPSNTGNCPM